jgi:hypothetical protein
MGLMWLTQWSNNMGESLMEECGGSEMNLPGTMDASAVVAEIMKQADTMGDLRPTFLYAVEKSMIDVLHALQEEMRHGEA